MLKQDSSWDLYVEGMEIGWKFSFSESDLKTFTVLSTDDSPIHTDHKFCQDRGFKSPLLHGALLTTQLSRLIGKELPDNKAMTVGFSIEFFNPSYVDEDLEFTAKLLYKSEATRIIELKFWISRQEVIIGKGKISAKWQSGKVTSVAIKPLAKSERSMTTP